MLKKQPINYVTLYTFSSKLLKNKFLGIIVLAILLITEGFRIEPVHAVPIDGLNISSERIKNDEEQFLNEVISGESQKSKVAIPSYRNYESLPTPFAPKKIYKLNGNQLTAEKIPSSVIPKISPLTTPFPPSASKNSEIPPPPNTFPSTGNQNNIAASKNWNPTPVNSWGNNTPTLPSNSRPMSQTEAEFIQQMSNKVSVAKSKAQPKLVKPSLVPPPAQTVNPPWKPISIPQLSPPQLRKDSPAPPSQTEIYSASSSVSYTAVPTQQNLNSNSSIGNCQSILPPNFQNYTTISPWGMYSPNKCQTVEEQGRTTAYNSPSYSNWPVQIQNRQGNLNPQTSYATPEVQVAKRFYQPNLPKNSYLNTSNSIYQAQSLMTESSENFSSPRKTLAQPEARFQGVYLLQGDESSARARVTGYYPINPNTGFGATVDLTDGLAFADSRTEGLQLNELYLALSLPDAPNVRFVIGQLDLTSYFDRNSFAKDATTHFFNSIFQTNSALAASGIGSRQGVLVNWTVVDNIEFKVAGFSSARAINDFRLDAFAGELGVRYGNAIIRGTYVTDRDAGIRDGFREIFRFDRPLPEDREEAFGINVEVFIPSANVGLFARYGQYNNLDLGLSGDTYNVGLNVLDLFARSDRFGIAYGKTLSNEKLRAQDGSFLPTAFEVIYDFLVFSNLRLGFTFQAIDDFSETILGFRVKTEFDMVNFK